MVLVVERLLVGFCMLLEEEVVLLVVVGEVSLTLLVAGWSVSEDSKWASRSRFRSEEGKRDEDKDDKDDKDEEEGEGGTGTGQKLKGGSIRKCLLYNSYAFSYRDGRPETSRMGISPDISLG